MSQVPRKILFGSNAREKIRKGINITAEAVKATLGPKGRSAIIEKPLDPVITKDGVTVAKEIELRDRFENIGVKLIKAVTRKTDYVAGDGTTTATVLAQAIIEKGIQHIAADHDPISIKYEIEQGAERVLQFLDKIAKPIKTLEQTVQVATISANDKEMGEIVGKVVHHLGKDCIATYQESNNTKISYEITSGMRLQRGFLHPMLIDGMEKQSWNPKGKIPVFVTDYKLMNQGLVAEKILNIALNELKSKHVLIIADDVSQDVLQMLVKNNLEGIVHAMVVKAPFFGAERDPNLEDVAIALGAKYMPTSAGGDVSVIDASFAGFADEIMVDKDNTTMINPAGNPKQIARRKEAIMKQIDSMDEGSEKERVKERFSRLESKAALIKVGAPTEMEMRAKKYQIQDALNATRAAVSEGVVPGGGIALVRAMADLDALKKANQLEMIGVSILKYALKQPFITIVENALGKHTGEAMFDKVSNQKNMAMGYDAADNKIVDMLKLGIVDPVKVTKNALQSAVSIASTFLVTETVIVDDIRPEDVRKILGWDRE